jgi:hypothetical protein
MFPLPSWLLFCVVFSFDTFTIQNPCFDVDCCVIDCRWLWAAPAQSNCYVFTLHLLLFRVHLRSGWLSHPLLLPSPWLPIKSNRGQKRLIVTFTPPILPSHLVEEAHHLQWSLHALVLMPRLFCRPVDHIDRSGVNRGKKTCVSGAIDPQIAAAARSNWNNNN